MAKQVHIHHRKIERQNICMYKKYLAEVYLCVCVRATVRACARPRVLLCVLYLQSTTSH